MSLESQRQRKRSAPPTMDRVAVSVSEFKSATGLSRPTIYRMMQQGNLRFAQIGALRRIPVSEFKRLGLV